jgi:UDP-3-O-[3-hydroxymyristoyl] glucosamine N-acyltransferase
LIYAESERWAQRAAASAAQCVIAPEGISFAGKTVLRAAEPKVAFARAAARFFSAAPAPAGLHAAAVISPEAQIGNRVHVGPFAAIEADAQVGDGCSIGAGCWIGEGVHLGRDCTLYPNVVIYPGAWLGDRVIVHAGAVLGSDGFGYVFDQGAYLKFPQLGTLVIEDDVEIGSNATVDRGSLGETRIARGTKLDNLVHVAHNVLISQHCVIAAQTGISGSSTLGEYVVVGGQVGIADHVRIEDRAVLGAQAGIPTSKIIRGGATYWGTPARKIEEFKKQYAVASRLPQLMEELKELQREVAELHRRTA